MTKKKRKLTAAQKAEKKRRKQEYMFVMMNGRQVRVKRPPTIDGLDIDTFLRRNADPTWLVQNEMWHLLGSEPDDE